MRRRVSARRNTSASAWQPMTKGCRKSSTACSARSLARSEISSISFASPRKIRPACVSSTVLVVRRKSCVFSSDSRECICCVTAGWVTWSCSAARAKLSVSATARKQASCMVFIPLAPLLN